MILTGENETRVSSTGRMILTGENETWVSSTGRMILTAENEVLGELSEYQFQVERPAIELTAPDEKLYDNSNNNTITIINNKKI